MAGLIAGATKKDETLEPTQALDEGAIIAPRTPVLKAPVVQEPKTPILTAPDASTPTPTPAPAGLITGAQSGIDITGITPQEVSQKGYEATPTPQAKGYQAGGYAAEGFTADQQTSSVSDELEKVLSDDSPYIQRARTSADLKSNARGLLNSSVAIGAGESAAIDAALPIAQGNVNVGMFNVDQSNKAKAQSVDARNQASAFLANAQNAASQFTSGEENKTAMFAVEQANLAARFAAEAQNAAEQMNAVAHNNAMQQYANAMNAASGAMAELASREKIANIDAGSRLAAANISAGAQLGAAGIEANSRAEISKGEWANRLEAAGIDAATRTHLAQMGIDAQAQQNMASLSQNTLTNVGNQIANIQSNPNMSTADKDAAIRNLLALYSGSPYLPVTVNWQSSPSTTTTIGGDGGTVGIITNNPVGSPTTSGGSGDGSNPNARGAGPIRPGG
jgi:hypothetical protein